MFEVLLDHFQSSQWSLWGPFLVLLLCGLGFPIPEDIVLITAGALGVIDGRSWLYVTLFMYAGVMLGDSITFFVGRFLGWKILRTCWCQRLFSPPKQARVQTLFHRYGSTVLFVGRFLPGLRAPIFFTAGSLHVSFLKFLLYDGLAALVSVPIFVWLGHWLWTRFHDDIAEFNKALAKTQHATLYVVGAIIIAVLIVAWRVYRKRMRNRISASAL